MSTAKSISREGDNQKIDQTKLIWLGPLAVTTATLANVLFYYLVTGVLQIQLYAPEQFPPPELSPIPVADVILFSLLFSVGAVIVLWFVSRFSGRQIRAYLIICVVVLVLSMILPLKIPTPPTPMSTKFSLMIMHVIGGIAVVGVLVAMNLQKKD